MRVDLTVPVYQWRDGHNHSWATIGLGKFNLIETGRSTTKMQRKMVEKLRSQIGEAAPSAVEHLHGVGGSKLLRARCDVVIKGGLSRRRVSGRFPLIVEPRYVNATDRKSFVFHPLRQDEWFVCDDLDNLDEALELFARHAWSSFDEDYFDYLRSDGKDRLQAISFSVAMHSLTEALNRQKKEEKKRAKNQRPAQNVLRQIGSDQTMRAIEGSLPLGSPRPSYRAQLGRLLGGPGKRSSVVLGEPGAGKSTLIHRLIADMLDGEDFPVHRNLDLVHHVWRISGKRIIAGMAFMGDWEQRCLDLLDECKRRRAILWVEDLHLFGRLGRTRQSDRNLAEFFRGPIARGELVIIGESTPEQWQRLEDDAPSLAALLAKVRVQATTTSETLQMLISEARQIEQRHGCRFDPFTYRTILEIGASLFPWTAFPGKALELLRQLGDEGARGDVSPNAVVKLVSRKTGLPETMLTLDQELALDALREAFAACVMGQERGIDAACELIARIRAGLTDPGRPYAVMLFTGPTGTGKTELARTIAKYLYGGGQRLLRIDMSEYAGHDAVPRLIGDRFEPSGFLTQRIREQPFSVVLLDEIDKAHRSVLHLLLQLFDEARLTDAAGNTASFHNAVIIMTSNLGAKPTRPIGFGQSPGGFLNDIAKAVRDFFPPELFNRIDTVVPFAPLDEAVAESIATKELAKLLARRGLRERNIFVYANKAVKARIVRQAFDPRHGARTVKRYLEDHITSLLAEEVSRSDRASLQVVRIYDQAGELRLHVEPLREVEPTKAALPLMRLMDESALSLREHLPEVIARLDRLDFGALREMFRDDPRRQHVLYYIDWLAERVAELRRWMSTRATTRVGPSPEMLEARAFSHQRRHQVSAQRKFKWSTRVRVFDSREGAPEAAPASKQQLLQTVAEARFLCRNAARVIEPEQHVIFVELLVMGSAGAAQRGLLSWLARSYAEGDHLEAAAARSANNRYENVSDLDDALARSPIHIVMKLNAFCVRDAFGGELGCHIYRSATAEPEIVRVRLLDAPADSEPRALIKQHLEARAAFERALDEGADRLPENPEGLAPAVRTLQLSGSLAASPTMSVAVEDFRTGMVETLIVRDIDAALSRVRLLWIGREET